MSQDYTWVEYSGWLQRETNGAVMFKAEGGEELWIPKSQLGEINYEDFGDTEDIEVESAVTGFEVSSWFGAKEGLTP